MKKLKRFLISKLNGFDIKNPPKIKKWEISADDKICVLAPHADDEVIGCGGLLAKYGKQCDVVLLTDGAFGGDEKIQKTREDEFSKVMNFLKIENFSFMRAKDTRLIEAFDLFKKLDFGKYDYVVMPHPLDPHKDHVVVQAFFKKFFEVLAFLLPFCYNITKTFPRKESTYESSYYRCRSGCQGHHCHRQRKVCRSRRKH